ncbi:LLM class F420-dependent oxidoreductase [Halioxenophilus sp. WMMB6]|uniref:LLM class F420-dependent oxidoreductase n=1 Tax=Halioxenophilus sp. WMMB6 TaxID=3073815 RepID=UPI00295E85F3|nr:LLM class F420-dependent oxidoreductase [Halioxenophilus sp. WMMB6]
MKVNAILPFDHLHAPEEFVTPEAVVEIAQLVEQLGYDGGNVTDHPCPSGKWLDNGGHYAQDPFVMLSFVAAATTTLKLQTGILVLPYRNPFITARSVATLDHFSRGRVVLGMGAGYMKGEYYALGVDFERRNELFDEYLQALKAAFTGEDFSFEGSGYSARNCRIRPTTVQRPHPPLLVGGNAPRAIRRAAELGDGWYPFFTHPTLSATARTFSIASMEELAKGIEYLHNHCEKIGRETPPFVMTGSLSIPGENLSSQGYIDRLGELKELGVIGCCYAVKGDTRAEWSDDARRFAEDVLAKI